MKSGLPPGTLVHVGVIQEAESRITLIDYSKEDIAEKTTQSADEILQYIDSDTLTWVIIEGLTNVGFAESIGAIFGIHQLVLEDILNTHQRPKFPVGRVYYYPGCIANLFLKEEMALGFNSNILPVGGEFVIIT